MADHDNTANVLPGGGPNAAQRELGARVLVVIVNFRTAGLAIECLRSLADEVLAAPRMRAVVVDNASGDGSVERIGAAIQSENWAGWVSVLPLERNGGFAFGNNAAVRRALESDDPPDYLYLLNPDTVVRPGAVRALAEFLDSHPGVGIAGSRLETPDGEVYSSAFRTPNPLGELDGAARLGVLSRLLRRYAVTQPFQDDAHDCEWAAGASMMVRRQVFESAGLLDEGYFLYFEEVDFCVRARKAGWSVGCVPASRVIHLGGAATSSVARGKRRLRSWFDSRRRFFVKRHGVLGLISADVLWALGRLSFLFRRALRLARKVPADPKWFAFDLLWGDAKALLTGAVFRIDRRCFTWACKQQGRDDPENARE